MLKELDRIDGFNWIRLLYTYPDTVTTDLLDTLAQGSRTVPYLDIPLQHCNDAVLKRMNRRGTRKDIEKLLDHLYKNYLYILLLMFSFFISFPFEMEANVMFTDWFFLSVPILALLAGVLLQVASLGNKKGKKTVHK